MPALFSAGNSMVSYISSLIAFLVSAIGFCVEHTVPYCPVTRYDTVPTALDPIQHTLAQKYTNIYIYCSFSLRHSGVKACATVFAATSRLLLSVSSATVCNKRLELHLSGWNLLWLFSTSTLYSLQAMCDLTDSKNFSTVPHSTSSTVSVTGEINVGHGTVSKVSGSDEENFVVSKVSQTALYRSRARCGVHGPRAHLSFRFRVLSSCSRL